MRYAIAATAAASVLAMSGEAFASCDSGETTIRFSVRTNGNEAAARGIGRAFIEEVTRQYTQDIPIWENKKYFAQPMLCDGDGPFGVYRKWMRQFFSEGEQESQAG